MSDPVTNESTAPPSSSDVLGAMSSSERQSWRLTGELPTKTSAVESETSATESDVREESSPAEPAAQAAEIAANLPPASEPGTPKKANAETRIRELLAKNAEQAAELERLRTSSLAPRPTASSDVPQESRPASQPVSLESVIESPDVRQPFMDETAFYAQFPDATVAHYVRYAASYQAERIAHRQTQHQTMQQRHAEFADRAKKAVPSVEVYQKLPAPLVDAIPADLMEPGQTPGLWNVAIQEILNAPESDRLMAHLADHPDAVQQIASTRDPNDTIRTIARIASRLEPSSVPPPTPVGNPVSLAPAPIQTLGKKPAQPADELADAIKQGDFARYRELQNRKDLKSA